MAVTRRAWESVSSIRWSQAGVPTGVREQHQTGGLGEDGSAQEKNGASGDLLEVHVSCPKRTTPTHLQLVWLRGSHK